MPQSTPRPFQFTLRSFLVVLVLIACALGFWLQERRLSKARNLLAAHGLAMEWANLEPDQVRATVVGRAESGSYMLLTVRVQAVQSASVMIRKEGNVRLGALLEPVPGSNAWSADVRVLVDTVNATAGESIVKVAFSAVSRGGEAHTHSVEKRAGNLPAAELVRLTASASAVFDLGEPIPLCEIGDEKFEIVVE